MARRLYSGVFFFFLPIPSIIFTLFLSLSPSVDMTQIQVCQAGFSPLNPCGTCLHFEIGGRRQTARWTSVHETGDDDPEVLMALRRFHGVGAGLVFLSLAAFLFVSISSK